MSELETLTAALADRYEIAREIGAGGMATVYLARDLKHDRQVALKVLREDLSASLGKERFLREIKVAAALQHPHVLPLYDSGEAGGLLYYVMPYVDGLSLREKLVKEGELPVSDAARILRDVADALSEAHRHGVVHRDLKPENVMLRGRHALVTDFGVAKALSEATGRQSLTTIGVALGTPTYMAPEQAVADPHVDHRADIYAFGVLAYELLAGRPPFTGMTPQQILAAHVTGTVEPITTHRNTIPPALATLVMKCLEKKPADRWQSADELIPQLEGVLTPSGGMTPTDTRPLAAAAPTVTGARRVPVRAIGVAVGLVVVVVAVLFWRSRQAGSVASNKSVAVLPFEDISGDTADRAFILGVQGEITTQLSKLPSLQVASRSASSAFYGTRKTHHDIAAELGVGKLLTGTVQRAGGQVHFTVALEDATSGRSVWADSYSKQLTPANLFAIQGEVAEKVAGALSVEMSAASVAEISRAPTTSLAGLDLYQRAELLWVERGSYRTDTLMVHLLEQSVKTDPSFARAWGLLAQAQSWLLRTGVAFDTLPGRHALDRVVALSPGSLEARLASGYYRYYGHADYAGALAEIQEAARILPNSAEIADAIGLLLLRLGRREDAIAAQTRAVQLDPHDMNGVDNLGWVYAVSARYREALDVLDAGLKVAPTSARVGWRKLVVLLALGDTASAAAFAREEHRVLAPADAAGIDGIVGWYRRDYDGEIVAARAAGSGGLTNSFGDAEGTAAQTTHVGTAVIRRLQGNRPAARASADSAVAAGEIVIGKARRRAGDPFGTLAFAQVQSAIALAAAGDSARAITLADSAARSPGVTRDDNSGPNMTYYLAIVCMLAGRPHDAVVHLKTVLAVPQRVTLSDLRLSFLWDPLRSDPEFKALLAKGGP